MAKEEARVGMEIQCGGGSNCLFVYDKTERKEKKRKEGNCQQKGESGVY